MALTGICVLGRDPTNCPDRVAQPEGDNAVVTPAASPIDVSEKLADLEAEPEKAQLYPGLELGLDDARKLDAASRCHLIGILGDPDAGKTAALVSLYLLLGRGRLLRYRIAASRSLMAFEHLARGSRRWEDGKIPAQLTVHTKLEDPRSPGFLHLRVRRRADAEKFDLLLPDLPGEWTEELIESDERERLSFLASARVLWLMVDGVLLADPDRRKDPIGRLKTLLRRLTKVIPLDTPLVAVVTRRDQAGDLPPGVLDGVLNRAVELGFARPAVVEIASFSDDPALVPPGTGIEDLLTLSLQKETLPPEAVVARPISHTVRHMLKHRRVDA